MITRRRFLSLSTAGAIGASLSKDGWALAPVRPIKLGFDNFALRAFGWKAAQLLDYAAELKVDALFISDLDSYESLGDSDLREVRKKADDLKIQLYAGGWSICPGSKSFKKTWGTPEALLATGIRVAKTLGSPVFRVVLGSMEDRKSPGGIAARINETKAVLKTCRQQALDAGVKIAVENHAGDMHSWELAQLVEETGPEYVGVNFDSGNAAWALEDPLSALKNLEPFVICSSLRDVMIWETPNGASVAWTAVGEGLLDWTKLKAQWRGLRGDVPMMVETISGFSREFPYKKPEFWEHYERRESALAEFEALAKRGNEIPNFKAPESADRKVAEQQFQKGELERSMKFLRAM